MKHYLLQMLLTVFLLAGYLPIQAKKVLTFTGQVESSEVVTLTNGKVTAPEALSSLLSGYTVSYPSKMTLDADGWKLSTVNKSFEIDGFNVGDVVTINLSANRLTTNGTVTTDLDTYKFVAQAGKESVPVTLTGTKIGLYTKDGQVCITSIEIQSADEVKEHYEMPETRIEAPQNRALWACQTFDGKKTFVSWRARKTDDTNTSYVLYKNGSVYDVFTDKTNVTIDGTADTYTTDTYRLEVKQGNAIDDTQTMDLKAGSVKPHSWMRIALAEEPVPTNTGIMWDKDGKDIGYKVRYTPNDMSCYDMDGDGKGEMIVKTSLGTKDGLGNFVFQSRIDKRGLDVTRDYTRQDDNGTKQKSNGHIGVGEEWLTVFEGSTGRELATIDFYPKFSVVSDWNEPKGSSNKYNKGTRFKACVAFLDGKNPSVVYNRGYYSQSFFTAYNWNGEHLYEVWLDSRHVDKYNDTTDSFERLYTFDSPSHPAHSINGTKENPNLQTDLFGDWREEVIFYDYDVTSTTPKTVSSKSINDGAEFTINWDNRQYYMVIFNTTVPTDYRLPWLRDDHIYDMSIVWQNIGYNQPPHLGYNPVTVYGKKEDTTSVRNIDVSSQTDTQYYTLQGLRVSTPVSRGLYIMNNKKIIVK